MGHMAMVGRGYAEPPISSRQAISIERKLQYKQRSKVNRYRPKAHTAKI